MVTLVSFDNERYDKMLREVKETQILRKNYQPLISKHNERYDKILREVLPVPTLIPHFFKIHFNSILLLTAWVSQEISSFEVSA
jgi:hypothetical protein